MNNGFDDDVDTGKIKGNYTENEDSESPVNEFIKNLTKKEDFEKPRYKEEPRFKNSRGNVIDENNNFNKNLGVNSNNKFGLRDEEDYDEDTSKPKQKKKGSSIINKLLMALAGLTIVKMLLKNEKIAAALEKIGIPVNTPKAIDIDGDGKPDIYANKTKLGLIGTLVVVGITFAFILFASSFFVQYIRNFGVSDGGLGAAIRKVKNPEENVEVFKTEIEKTVMPYTKQSDTIINLINSNGTVTPAEFKASKDSGFVEVEIERYKDTKSIYKIWVVSEYEKDNRPNKK